MESMFLPILVAASVMLLVYGGGRMAVSLADAEKRKLKQRLSTEGGSQAMSAVHRSITLQQPTNGLSSSLAQVSFFAKLNRTLEQAYPEMPLSKFVAIAAGAGAGVFAMTLLVSQSWIVAGLAGAIGVYGPCIWLGVKRSKRQRLLADQLPEALDFLGRILKAGHSLSTGVQMMSEELPQPLSGEFRRAYDQHSLGASLDDCLKDAAKRIESTDFAFFVTAVLIQRQTGGDLSEVLGNISDMIRQRIRLEQHIKARTAEGRFTGYILSVFPALMFVIAYMLNPGYAGVLLQGSGLVLLGVALVMQLLGLYFIKKITTVTV